MRDQETGCWADRNRWRDGQQTPVSPPITNVNIARCIHRHREPTRPAVHREQPVETFTAGRNGDEHAGDAEIALMFAPAPWWKKWCSQTMKSGCRSRALQDHRAIAEQRLARESRDDFGKDAERRQDQMYTSGCPQIQMSSCRASSCRRRHRDKWKSRYPVEHQQAERHVSTGRRR